MKLEEEKLEAQMEYARYEHETEMLREREFYRHFFALQLTPSRGFTMYLITYNFIELRLREMDRERQKIEWEMKERQAEEQRRMDEEMMRRHTDEMSLRMHHQEDDLRRRQKENTIFIQVRIRRWASRLTGSSAQIETNSFRSKTIILSRCRYSSNSGTVFSIVTHIQPFTMFATRTSRFCKHPHATLSDLDRDFESAKFLRRGYINFQKEALLNNLFWLMCRKIEKQIRLRFNLSQFWPD